MPALVQKPRLECGKLRKGHAIEEFLIQAGQGYRIRPGAQRDYMNIDERARGKRKSDLMTLERVRSLQQFSEFSEVPSQGAQGIVCVREKQ